MALFRFCIEPCHSFSCYVSKENNPTAFLSTLTIIQHLLNVPQAAVGAAEAVVTECFANEIILFFLIIRPQHFFTLHWCSGR